MSADIKQRRRNTDVAEMSNGNNVTPLRLGRTNAGDIAKSLKHMGWAFPYRMNTGCRDKPAVMDFGAGLSRQGIRHVTS
jgi:hypothetical protein